MSDQRSEAGWLASHDVQGALAVARGLPSPRERVQALGWVARFAPDDHVEAAAQEALGIAWQSADRFQTVLAAAWPLRALIERGRLEVARTALSDLLGAVEL